MSDSVLRQILEAIKNVTVGGGGGGGTSQATIEAALNAASSIDAVVTGTVDVGNFPTSQPVSAASLPLPTGAATAANQTPWLPEFSSDPANLTAPGVTPALDCSARNGPLAAWKITCTVTNVDTTVTLRAVDEDDKPLAIDAVLSSDDDVVFTGSYTPSDSIALRFVAETGGTNAVVSDIRMRANAQ